MEAGTEDIARLEGKKDEKKGKGKKGRDGEREDKGKTGRLI